MLSVFERVLTSRPANRMDGLTVVLLTEYPTAMLPTLSIAMLPIQR